GESDCGRARPLPGSGSWTSRPFFRRQLAYFTCWSWFCDCPDEPPERLPAEPCPSPCFPPPQATRGSDRTVTAVKAREGRTGCMEFPSVGVDRAKVNTPTMLPGRGFPSPNHSPDLSFVDPPVNFWK